MGKYYLVAYYYNKKTKKKENIKFIKEYYKKTLLEIDKYTSNKSFYEIKKEIELKNKNYEMNGIEIRYYPLSTKEKYYTMSVITDDIEYYKTINNISEPKKNKPYTIKRLDPNLYEARYIFETLLLDLKKDIIDMIYTDNYEEKNEFRKHLNYYFKEYNNLSYIDKQEIIELLLEEFGYYKNYRKWIVAKHKKALQNNYNYRKSVLEFNEEIYPEGLSREDLENSFSDIYHSQDKVQTLSHNKRR